MYFIHLFLGEDVSMQFIEGLKGTEMNQPHPPVSSCIVFVALESRAGHLCAQVRN